nr:MAG TPA: hypothetical protein [Caudoviricetes sp.]
MVFHRYLFSFYTYRILCGKKQKLNWSNPTSLDKTKNSRPRQEL